MIIEIIIIIFVIIIIWFRVHGRGESVLYFVRRWEWRAVRSNQISEFQDKDTFVTMIVSNIFQHFKEISEVCYIHIYIYTLSYLQYIQIYTIHTIYTDIYIPTVSTDIYKYIQLYTNICKVEGGVVADCEYVTIMRNTLRFVSLYVRDFNLCDRP